MPSSHSLDRIAVKDDSFFFRNLPDLRNRMNRSNLVIGPHDRDQHGLVGDRFAHRVRIDHPEFVDRKISHGRLAGPFQRAATIEHRLVLGDAGDDVVALFLVELDHALDSQVVGFGRPAGEDDVLRRGANQRRNLVARELPDPIGAEFATTSDEISFGQDVRTAVVGGAHPYA